VNESTGLNKTPQWDYDAFLSYSTRADYKLAVKLEEFLEGFHEERGIQGRRLKPMRICRDGGDFVLPRSRGRPSPPEGQHLEPIKALIRPYLERSAALVILWPGRDQSTAFMDWELQEFLRQNNDNQWDRPVRIAVTQGEDPAAAPNSFFSDTQLEIGLHHEIFFDLRGQQSNSSALKKVRDFDRERMRLAVDLRAPIDPQGNSLAADDLIAGWQREQERQFRKRRKIKSALVLSFAVFAAITTGFGFYAIQKKRLSEKADQWTDQSLTEKYFHVIGPPSGVGPSREEIEAVWELAQLPPAKHGVRKQIITSWLETDASTFRATDNDALGLHAAIGLNTPVREHFDSRAIKASQRLLAALEAKPGVNSGREGFALAPLAATMSPDDVAPFAARAAFALVRILNDTHEDESDRLDRAAEAFSKLALHLDPADAALTARELVKSIVNPLSDDAQLRELQFALEGVAARLAPTEAAALAPLLANALAKQDSSQQGSKRRRSVLAASLRLLGAQPTPAGAGSLSESPATALDDTLEKDSTRLSQSVSVLVGVMLAPESDPDDVRMSASALSALAPSLQGDSTASLVESLLEALIAETDFDRRSSLSHAVSALSRTLNSDDAGILAGRLVMELENTPDAFLEELHERNSFRSAALADTLAALTLRMKTNDAAVLVARGALAVAKGLQNAHANRTGSLALSVSGSALATLAAQIPPAKTKETRLIALSSIFLYPIMVSQEGDFGDETRNTVRNVCLVLSTNELVEVLKWPFCVGKAQKLVLAELEKRLSPRERFQGDLWKFVHQAPKLGFSQKLLDAPATRPRTEVAIGELEALISITKISEASASRLLSQPSSDQ